MAGLVDFQNESEVKAYLDSLGIEYSYQCHKERDAEGCQRLADYLEGIKKNYDLAAQVLKKNCEENHYGESCFKLGAYYVGGKGGLQQNLKAAYDCFVKSCEKGGKKSVDACHNVGLLAHDGRALDKSDAVVARDYYTKACNGNFTASCFNLSTLYIQGAPGVAKDMSQALKYSLRACDQGHIWACANASRMYKLGEGTQTDNEKAELLKNRARDLHKEQKQYSPEFKLGV
ncbi:cytochrome c oxidase assembly factor 7A [Callorhinchus milii]|uniref:Cytochrome c oxidase assembly factor 7 n=1 Tax=Callorhinchus milii TaxID=7868 RepID=V9L6W5_CALMI|nr:cytochrome c oxidase assembly factor 7A [Callorhinchus milii]|eukprot:gi/632963718/ref/XP_007898042.1/ PREDICTED: cytochrome c oxidase assembly factor 7A [Callorhinchus milii]